MQNVDVFLKYGFKKDNRDAVSAVVLSPSSTELINLVRLPYLSLALLHNFAFPAHATQSTSVVCTVAEPHAV